MTHNVVRITVGIKKTHYSKIIVKYSGIRNILTNNDEQHIPGQLRINIKTNTIACIVRIIHWKLQRD